LLGFFVNTLALRLDLSGAPDGAELLARVRRAALDAQDHQDLPFEQVVEILQPQRRLDRNPLVQVTFALQNNEAGRLAAPGLQFQPAEAPYDRIRFDLEAHLFEAGEEIVGWLGYATALFDEATIARWRDYFLAALRGLVTGLARPVTQLPLLSGEERHKLLVDWNETAADYPRDKCVHELFEDQAARTPGRRSLTASLTRAPTGWRIICEAWASAPTPAWRCASSGLWRWWWLSWRCLKPAAPMCRSIPPIRPYILTSRVSRLWACSYQGLRMAASSGSPPKMT
jgi:non-ribosomal peptide synthetase component F